LLLLLPLLLLPPPPLPLLAFDSSGASACWLRAAYANACSLRC